MKTDYCRECGLPLSNGEGIITRQGRFCSYSHANASAREYAWEKYSRTDFESLLELPHHMVRYA